MIPEEQYPKLQIIKMKSTGKVKERARRGKTNSLFVCFRPPCASPLGHKDDSFDYESKSSRMVNPRAARDGKVSIDVGDGKGSRPVVGGDGGDKEKDMAGEPWSKGRPVLAYIALHPGGHNYVIQTPAEILAASPTGRRKMVHAAFAKVFNAMTSFRNSTQSTVCVIVQKPLIFLKFVVVFVHVVYIYRDVEYVLFIVLDGVRLDRLKTSIQEFGIGLCHAGAN